MKDNKLGACILQKLKSSDLADVKTDLKAFLRPVLANERHDLDAKEQAYRADVALRCLHAYCTNLDKIQFDRLAFVDVIIDCAWCCVLIKPSAKDPMTLPKLLLHLVAKCVDLSVMPLDKACELARCLQNNLLLNGLPLAPESATLADQAAQYVWYSCNKCNKGKPDCHQLQPAIVFDGYCSALKLYAIATKELYRMPSKLLLALTSLDISSVDDWSVLMAPLMNSVFEVYQRCISNAVGNDDTVCLPYICSLSAMVFIYRVFLLSKCFFKELSTVVSSISWGKLPMTTVRKADKAALLLMFDISKELEVVVTGAKCPGNVLTAGVVLKCVDVMNKELSKAIPLIGEASEMTLSAVLTAVDSATELLSCLNCNVESCSDTMLDSLALFLKCRTQLNSLRMSVSAHSKKPTDSSHSSSVQMEIDVLIKKLEIQLVRMQRQCGDKVKKENCVGDLSAVAQFVHQSVTIKQATSVEYIRCGGLAFRLGWQLYTELKFSDTVTCLDICLKQYDHFKKSGTSEADCKKAQKKIQVLKAYEVMADASKKLGRIDDAMSAVVNSYLEDSQQMSVAATGWMRIVNKQVDESKCKQKPFRTLTSVVRERKSNAMKTSEIVTLLKEELKAVQKNRLYVAEYHMAILDELLAVAQCDRLTRASALIEKALLIGGYSLSTTDKSPVDMCHEAIAVLNCPDETNRCELDTLARAYLCLYILRSPDQVDKLFESTTRAITNVSRRRISALSFDNPSLQEDADHDWDEIFTVCNQLAAESDLLQPVDKAHDIWSKCFHTGTKSNKSIEASHDLNTTVDFIEVLVLIYKLMKNTKLLEALHLLSKVALMANDVPRQLVASTELISLCNGLQQPQAALEHIDLMETNMASSDVYLKSIRLYIEFLLAKAETLTLLNKVEEAAAVVDDAAKHRVASLKPSSKDDIIVEAEVFLARAKLHTALLAVDCEETRCRSKARDRSKTNAIELPLELSVSSTRQIAGLMQYLFSEKRTDTSKNSLADKWRLIDLFCRSAVYAGACYIQIGDQREAKCYLLQCLRFCEVFRLRKRFSEIHVMLARLSVLSARYNDCTAHVNLLNFILYDDNNSGRTSNSLPSETRTPVSSKVDNCSAEDDANASDLIKSRITSLDYQTVNELGESPTNARRVAVKQPATWTHPAKCPCKSCCDPFLEHVRMSCYIVDTLSRLKQGRTSDAEEMLRVAIQQASRLLTNATQHLKGLNSSKSCKSNASSSVSAENFYRNVLNEANVLLCELMLTEDRNVERFSAQYEKTLEVIKRNFSPYNFSHLHATEMYYLASLPGLTWPTSASESRTDSLSQIDLICAGIGRLKTTDGEGSTPVKVKTFSIYDDDDENVQQPSVAAGRTRKKLPSVTGAPVKQRPTAGTRNTARRVAASSEVAEIPRASARSTECKDVKSTNQKYDSQPELAVTSSALGSLSAIITTPQFACDRLQCAFKIQQQNPTTIMYRKVCNTLAAELLASRSCSDNWKISYYLSEAQSTTFRHACLLNNSRKLRKLSDNHGVKNVDEYRHSLQTVRQRLMFGTDPCSFKEAVDSLPEDLTVCQLSVVDVIGRPYGQLILTRLQSNNNPLVINLPGFSTPEGQRLLAEFDAVMQENRNSMAIKEKSEWWNRRRNLDTKLQELLQDMEQQYIGCWRGALLGRISDDKTRERILSVVGELVVKFNLQNVDTQLLQCLLEMACTESINDRDVVTGLQFIITTKVDKTVLLQLVTGIKNHLKRLNIDAGTRRGPVALVLDRTIQQLPWENMPILMNHLVTRLPSVYFTAALNWSLNSEPSSVMKTGVRRQSVYYVVNPDNNLPSTQQTFQPWFEKEPGWQGVVGRPPTAVEMIDAITNYDFFVYCGHGTGNAYLVEETLQQQPCHAAVMLMGCSSGKLETHGQLDATGTLLHYFLAGSGCIIGNLWDVTDREIDRFQETTLRSWLDSDAEDRSLVEAMRLGRSACKLRWLTAAAPVMYGFPVSMAARTSSSSSKPQQKTASKRTVAVGKRS